MAGVNNPYGAPGTTSPFLNNPFVVEFRVNEDTKKLDTDDSTGFDWVEVDPKQDDKEKVIKIKKHRDIDIESCCEGIVDLRTFNFRKFSSQSTTTSDQATLEDVYDTLGDKSLFDVHTAEGMRLNFSMSVMTLSGEAGKTRNLQMVFALGTVSGKRQWPVPIYWRVGDGLKVTVSDQTYNYISRGDEAQLEINSADKIQLQISCEKDIPNEKELFIKIYADVENNNLIGLLKVLIYPVLPYQVLVCPLVDVSLGDTSKCAKKAKTLCKTFQVTKFNEQLKKYFAQAGINATATLFNGFATYDSKDANFGDAINADGKISDGDSFLQHIEKQIPFTSNNNVILYKIDSDGNPKPINWISQGSIVFLLDRESGQSTSGIGNIGQHCTMIYKEVVAIQPSGGYYPACCHEIGHNLGCLHTFTIDDARNKENKTSRQIIATNIEKTKHTLNADKATVCWNMEGYNTYANENELSDSDKYKPENVANYYDNEFSKSKEFKNPDEATKQLIDNVNQANEDYMSTQSSMPVVFYTKGATHNLMDYGLDENWVPNCLFVWQWKTVRLYAQQNMRR